MTIPRHGSSRARADSDRVEITHADLPGPVSVSRGQFSVKQEKVNFSETAITIADASWLGAGTFEYLKEAPRLFVATAGRERSAPK